MKLHFEKCWCIKLGLDQIRLSGCPNIPERQCCIWNIETVTEILPFFSGRIHGALVSGVNPTSRSVTVEWFEKGETKGKEIEVEQLYGLNPQLISSQPPSNNNVTTVASSNEVSKSEITVDDKRSTRVVNLMFFWLLDSEWWRWVHWRHTCPMQAWASINLECFCFVLLLLKRFRISVCFSDSPSSTIASIGTTETAGQCSKRCSKRRVLFLIWNTFLY